MDRSVFKRLFPRLAAALLVATPFAAAQEQPEPASAAVDVEERVDRAIKDYEKAKKDKDNHALRRRTIGWLGEIDHPRVDEYLAKDLRAHARWESGSWAIEAITKVDRPQLADALMDALFRGNSHWSVRRAAARALAGYGAEHVTKVLTRLDGEKNAGVRAAVMGAVALTDSQAAMDWIADRLVEGDHNARLAVVTATDGARGVEAVDRARVRCIKEGNLLLSASAWRVLAEQGHPRAPELTVDVLERVFDQPDARSAGELIRGLVLVDDPDFYPAILRFGAVRGAGVTNALRASAGAVADRPELIEYLIEEGLESESAAERSATKTLLSKAPASALAPLVETVRKQLKRNRKRALETVIGLHELLSKDPTWVQDVAELARKRDLESRMFGLALLLEMGSPAAIEAAQDYTDNRAWELRSLAYRYLAKNRDVTSIPSLIKRYGKEEGRLAHELDTALFVHTGTRCWTASNWRSWWREHETGFTLPHPNTVKGGGSTTGGQTVSYYDIPLVSARVAFIVDRSGSMNAKVGTDRKRTRLDLAKKQLRDVISALPKTHKVNLISYSGGVDPLWDDIKKLTSSNRDEFLDEVEKMKAEGGTNTYGALVRAFRDPDVDTIYLLTDGQPTAGELTNPDDIIDAIMAENRLRQVVIHCIGVGLDSQLLKDLAALSGGEYKYVR